MSKIIPCALCGTTEIDRVIGRTGCVCLDCLAEAAKAAISLSTKRTPPNVTATDHCLLCGETVTASNLAAVRKPYVICHKCLIETLERAGDNTENGEFIQVEF